MHTSLPSNTRGGGEHDQVLTEPLGSQVASWPGTNQMSSSPMFQCLA